MKVTHDDDTRFAVENVATGAWMLVGLIVLGALGGVGVVSYQSGVVDPFLVKMAGIGLTIIVPLLVGASPSVALSFERGPQEVRIRHTWPLYSTEKAIAFSAFDRVEVERRYGNQGTVSFGLALRLRNGGKVWLGQVTWDDEKEIRALATRMNAVLGLAPKAVRRQETGRLRR